MSACKVSKSQYFQIKHLTYKDAAKKLGVSKSAIQRAHKRYGIQGVEVSSKKHAEEILGRPLKGKSIDKQVEDLNRQLLVEKQKVQELMRAMGRNVVIRSVPENTFKVALIADTHYGSLYHHGGALKGFLELAKKEGVADVLHAGDVLEGHLKHFGHEFELSAHGLTDQIDLMENEFPSDLGLSVKFITGNHDDSYKKAIGLDVGNVIASQMGWDYIGDCFGEVEYQTPEGNYKIVLMHPGGGTAYALSYKLQKIIEQWEGGKKPNALVAGHFHKSIWLPQYRNVSAFHPGCFQKQTPFMASHNSAAHVAGWIIEVTVGGTWNMTNARCVSFY